MDKIETWIKIADCMDEIHFSKNNIAEVIVSGKAICIIQTADGLKACASKCPHASGDLSEGLLDKSGNIICPVHNYRFNLSNGRDTNSEGYFLKIFKIKENEEGIFLEME